MLSLQDRQWLSFSIGSLFTVSRPVARSKDDYDEGDIPFVASGATNNGIAKYCRPKEDEILDSPGCISVSPVDGSCFYQPIAFLGRGGGGSSIMLLRNEIINCYSGIFTARMLTQTLGSKYTYGRMGNSKTIIREQLLLPANELGNPDWQFMEDYIREREVIQVERCREFLMKRITDIEERERESKTGPRHLPSLSEKTWHKFKAFGPDGLFQIKTTNSSIDAVRLVKGRDQRCPYITRTDSNNGIARFVSSRNKEMGFDLAGTITIGLDTQTAYYQPANYVTGQNIQIVSGENLSEPVALFLLSILRSQMKAKFNWGGNGATLGRLLELQIMLPATDDGLPDYSYMSSYSHNIALHTLKRQLAFLNR